jgi:uncharacterized protein YecT (DUF1311 family)
MTYDQLPECIKSTLTAEQFAWLPDRDKETLVQSQTEPEEE